MLRIDSIDFDLASAQFDEINGWLDVSGTAAVVGVMQYPTGAEYLPRETLVQTAAGLVGVPVTVEHPDDLVTPDNAREHMRGTVLAAEMHEDALKVRVRVMDAEAISAIQAGKRELSPGYRVDMKIQAGEFTGEKYDAVQVGRCGTIIWRSSTVRVAVEERG